MPPTQKPPVRRRLPGAGLLGPHFYYDLIRLARKGWPTFARVFYLGILLVALTFMYQTQGANVAHAQPAAFAERALAYAYTLIVLQDLLVLVMMPVYLASAIAEEKENQTLESLSLTHLTDTELVLGKLFGRLMHVGAVVLSGLPLLAFMHLWGNVEIELLLYHEVNTFLLLITAGSVCIWKSARSESTFEAISGAYPFMALMAVLGMGVAFLLPWICGTCILGGRAGGGMATARFLPMLPVLVIVHVPIIVLILRDTIGRMEFLRREERRRPRKTTGALTLADDFKPPPKTGKRGETRSRIHPLAWPIWGDALWWKECLKDGTSWSLSYRWVLLTLGVIPFVGALFRLAGSGMNQANRDGFLALPLVLLYDAYFVALAAYLMVVLFQMTMSVAGEREHGTLTFLLLIPESRTWILFTKWLGPWWRNWPILAIAYFGVIVGLSCGGCSFTTALLLLLLPWPLLLMLGGLAFLLSVLCRRVLHANIAVVGFLGLLGVAHIAAWQQTAIIASFFIALLGDRRIDDVMKGLTWPEAAAWALGEQALFLLIGGACIGLAFWIFGRRDYAGT